MLLYEFLERSNIELQLTNIFVEPETVKIQNMSQKCKLK
jgi:hypothetical protein